MSDFNGTNGATMDVDEDAIKESIQAITTVTSGEKPFNVPEELASKLAKARAAVGRVGKNGQNRDQNYSYVRAEDVVKEASEALNAADVVVPAPQLEDVKFEDMSSRGGASGKFVTAVFFFRVIDGETGKGFVTRRIGTATDYPGDKAIYKAETGATKYFLASLLGMPLGDGNEDPETTVHGKGGAVNKKDDSPASDKQKELFKKLIGEKNLPRPARKAIFAFVGGGTPKKGAISHAIDQLMNADPLKFASECGWDGTTDAEAVQEAPAPDSGVSNPPPVETPATEPQQNDTLVHLPPAEGKALLQFCRDRNATRGELVVILRSVGINLPPDDQLTNEIVQQAVETAPIAQVARIKQMIQSSADSKRAAEAAMDSANEPAQDASQAPAPPVTGTDTPSSTDEIDPQSPLGKTLARISALGYKGEFTNVTWLMFDKETLTALTEQELTEVTQVLTRANQIGIQKASIAACIRKARESNHGLEERSTRFIEWIANREDTAQAVQQADQAGADAEGPQQ